MYSKKLYCNEEAVLCSFNKSIVNINDFIKIKMYVYIEIFVKKLN